MEKYILKYDKIRSLILAKLNIKIISLAISNNMLELKNNLLCKVPIKLNVI